MGIASARDCGPVSRRARRDMGATPSIVTGKMDLVKKGLSYDTLCVPPVPGHASRAGTRMLLWMVRQR